MARLLLLAVVLIPSICFAQEHRIDKALAACTDKDQSTAGMVQCIDKAYKAWDAELNLSYNNLMRKLDAPSRQSLKAAQTAWIKYRDSEFKLIESMFSTLEGTMYIPMSADMQMQVVKKRALELGDYLSFLNEHK
jgi:uncharacterized protein YecT (DUF1311 family)